MADNVEANDQVRRRRGRPARNQGANCGRPIPAEELPRPVENQILEELGRLRRTQPNERIYLLSEFRKQRPPVFAGELDPRVAESWIHQIEKMLETMGITVHTDKIALASYQLEREADHWWSLMKNSQTRQT